MKIKIVLQAFLLFFISLFTSSIFAQEYVKIPALEARVTDLTNTFSAFEKSALERTLKDFEEVKGSQIAVLVVPTTQPEEIEQYSIRVVEDWKLGRGKVNGQSVDDGVLLLIAKNDRKVRIEVGYGLEGAIPDALAYRIINSIITPQFRNGNFYEGTRSGVEAILKLVDGEELPLPEDDLEGDLPSLFNFLPFIFMFFFFAMPILGGLLKNSAVKTAVALASGVGAGIFFGPIPGVFVTIFMFAILFGKNGGGNGGTRGGRGGWIGGGGGTTIRGGGGWSGGGGFSGGGGSFGGGGASGSW